MPPPDNAMSNLEQQGIVREVTDNTWNYKFDSDLRNKVNLDINPTNPQADIIAVNSGSWTSTWSNQHLKAPIPSDPLTKQTHHPLQQPPHL